MFAGYYHDEADSTRLVEYFLVHEAVDEVQKIAAGIREAGDIRVSELLIGRLVEMRKESL